MIVTDTCFARLYGKGRDNIVGLVAVNLFASDVERARRLTCKGI